MVRSAVAGVARFTVGRSRMKVLSTPARGRVSQRQGGEGDGGFKGSPRKNTGLRNWAGGFNLEAEGGESAAVCVGSV